MRLPTVLRGYLLVGSVLIIGVMFLYTNTLIHRLNEQADFFSTLLARFFATATLPAADNPEIGRIVKQMTERLDFPVIITDAAGRPMAWTRRGTGVDPASVSLRESQSMQPDHPPEGPLSRLVDLTREMDQHHRPIPIELPTTHQVIGLVHYGESDIIEELRWYPIAELMAVFLFGMIGYWGFVNVKRAEQRSIWVGMAMETAHQLGTPLSSLMGWVELLRDRLGLTEQDVSPVGTPDARAAVGVSAEARGASAPSLEHSSGVLPTSGGIVSTEDRAFVQEILREMEHDLERVTKVANRFGHIGSIPHLVPQDIVPIVWETVQYVRRRIPRLGVQVALRESYEDVPVVHLNRELFEWAMENLLKNAVDASTEAGQTIDVSVHKRSESETVEVVVRDTGRGMTPAEQHQAFSPGYTTKAAGWGLGLTLVKRIVEEYHGGHVWIRESAPGQGTTFVMSFPV
jgi:signal transduction histidine kinase